MSNLINPYLFLIVSGPPVVQARAQGANIAADTTSHPITLPSGIVAGNFLMALFSVDGAPTVSVDTGASGSNWNKLGQASDGASAVTGAVFWKIAEGSDVLTLTTSDAQRSSFITFRIANATTMSGTSSNGNSTNSDPPSHDAGEEDDYLWIATRSGDSTTVPGGDPSNYDNLVNEGAGHAAGASSSTAERTFTTQIEDPGTFNVAINEWVSWTLAVKP